MFLGDADMPLLLTCERVCHAWARHIQSALAALDLFPYRERVTDAVVALLTARYRNLQSLSLRRCLAVTDAAMPSVARLHALARLDVFGTDVADFAPIATHPKLAALSLGGNARISGAQLSRLPSRLVSLDLAWLTLDMRVAKKTFVSLAHLTCLESLTLTHVNEQLIFDDDHEVIDLDAVVDADAQDMQFPAAISGCLRTLGLHHVKWLEDQSLVTLVAPCTQLRSLALTAVPLLTGKAFEMLGAPMLPALRELRFRDCGTLTREGFAWLTEKMVQLTHFALVGKTPRLNRATLKALVNLTALEHLELSCGDRLVDAGAHSDLCDIIQTMRLRTLILHDAYYVQGESLRQMVNTQGATLETLHIMGAACLRLPDVAAALRNLEKLRDVVLEHAQFQRGIDFDVKSARVNVVPHAYALPEPLAVVPVEEHDQDAPDFVIRLFTNFLNRNRQLGQ